MWQAQMFSEIGKAIQQDYTNLYSARQTEENQRRAIRANERAMQNKYQWQMQDMIKAGLNPMLAAGATPGMLGSPAPASSATHSGGSALGQSIAANRQAKVQENLSKEQLKLLKQQVKKVAEETQGAHNSAQAVEYENVERQIWADFLQNASGEALGLLKKLGLGGAAAGAAYGVGKKLNKSKSKTSPTQTKPLDKSKYNKDGTRKNPEKGTGSKKNPVKGKMNARPGQWYKDLNGNLHKKLN